MIRCIKLWTGADQKSHFEEGFIELDPGARGDALSVKVPTASASLHETDADPTVWAARYLATNGKRRLIGSVWHGSDCR